MKKRVGEILKRPLKITFINPNIEEDIVQAMAGVLAYNLANNNENIVFDYSKSRQVQEKCEMGY